jgi:hypothetical protein
MAASNLIELLLESSALLVQCQALHVICHVLMLWVENLLLRVVIKNSLCELIIDILFSGIVWLPCIFVKLLGLPLLELLNLVLNEHLSLLQLIDIVLVVYLITHLLPLALVINLVLL